VPPENRGTGISAAPGGAGEMTIELIPIFGISIPVIVRHGNPPPAAASLADLALAQTDKGTALTATIGRSGFGSLFGDVVVRYVKDGAEPLVVGEVSRLAVYPEIARRRIAVPVALPGGGALGKGRLEVVYQSAGETRTPLASAVLEMK